MWEVLWNSIWVLQLFIEFLLLLLGEEIGIHISLSMGLRSG